MVRLGVMWFGKAGLVRFGIMGSGEVRRGEVWYGKAGWVG